MSDYISKLHIQLPQALDNFATVYFEDDWRMAAPTGRESSALRKYEEAQIQLAANLVSPSKGLAGLLGLASVDPHLLPFMEKTEEIEEAIWKRSRRAGVRKMAWQALRGFLHDGYFESFLFRPEFGDQVPIPAHSWLSAQNDAAYLDGSCVLLFEDGRRVDGKVRLLARDFAGAALERWRRDGGATPLAVSDREMPTDASPEGHLDEAPAASSAPKKKGARQALAAELLARAFPDGIPAKGAMKPNELTSRALNEHKREDGIAPSSETIERAAGWRT